MPGNSHGDERAGPDQVPRAGTTQRAGPDQVPRAGTTQRDGPDQVPRAGTTQRDGQRDPPADSTQMILEGIQALHARLDELERLAAARERAAPAGGQRTGQGGTHGFVPAWLRRTEGEARWQVTLAVAAAIALQLPLTDRLVVVRPVWLMPVVEVLLLVVLVAANPHRIDTESRVIRLLSLALAALISFANAWSVTELVVGLVRGTAGNTSGPLLVTGGAIWLTNIIVFALWYWEFDRGGPVARAYATRAYPDFQFVQMVSPQMAAPDWEPAFGDYLYLSFTNAAAFSPTDVMPLSRWAKMAMTAQSVVSIVTVALVVARAVNILR
jgi:uncharacterized membrane protein